MVFCACYTPMTIKEHFYPIVFKKFSYFTFYNPVPHHAISQIPKRLFCRVFLC